MFSILLTPFLMLLSVFGLYSHQPPPQPSRPSAIVRPTTVASETSTPTPVPKPVPVAVKAPETKPEPIATPAPVIPKPQTDFATDTESRILALMNVERASEGLGGLAIDAQLAKLARAHSVDMLAKDYFDHNDPDGCSSSCRANEAGYAWSSIGENIYMTDGYELSSEQEASMVVDGWMHSSGHRANILGSKYTHAGVGVVASGEEVYITAVYAKPR